jgi:hypothetical protein
LRFIVAADHLSSGGKKMYSFKTLRSLKAAATSQANGDSTAMLASVSTKPRR